MDLTRRLLRRVVGEAHRVDQGHREMHEQPGERRWTWPRFTRTEVAITAASVRRYLRIFVVTAAAVVALGAAIVCTYIVAKSYQIRVLDRGFAHLALGGTSEEVVATMGPPHEVRTGGDQWPLPSNRRDDGHVSVAGQVTSTVQFWYYVDTVYLPVMWIISFDQHMRIIAKTRLD